jgi:hypothetical protein
MSLHKRLKRLEVRAGGKPWSPSAREQHILDISDTLRVYR